MAMSRKPSSRAMIGCYTFRMKNNHQSGSVLVYIIVLGAIAAGAYFVKDQSGKSYLEDGISMIKYYLVDRNQQAIQGAQNARDIMNKQQATLQAQVDATN